ASLRSTAQLSFMSLRTFNTSDARCMSFLNPTTISSAMTVLLSSDEECKARAASAAHGARKNGGNLPGVPATVPEGQQSRQPARTAITVCISSNGGGAASALHREWA